MESNNNEIICSICYESFDELHPSHTANCSQTNHLYHSKCLKCWYNRLLELSNIYDDNDKIINKSACPLCSDNENKFVEKKFWSILRIFQFEETIKKESETYTYRLNTILLEEGGELLSNPKLFERVRKDESLLYGYKIVEYKCNPSQDSYVYYTGPKMFKKCNSFIFKEKIFEDTYINDTGNFALSATINNITEHPSNRDMYILIPPTIIDKTLSYFNIIMFKVILIIVISLYYLI